MNSESSTPETDLDLTQFACRFLKEHGAILESGHEVINILLTSRFLAQSDEQKEGLLDFAINMDTGALAPGMMQMLYNAEKEY